MAPKKETALAPTGDPFAVLRQMTSELDRAFEGWPSSFRWPAFRAQPALEAVAWIPGIDVFEKDNRLITKVDLPGLKKEDVKVEVTDGHLAISGERKRETEEKKEHFYRSEREYGSFYRTVPLPDGAKLEDVKAMFADGVLEVSVPLPPKAETQVRNIEIQEAARVAKTVA